MQINQLRYFVAVAEHLNFSAAAEALHMATSPLSQRIRDLELELQCELFLRTTRHTSLTPAGEALLPKARSVLKDIDDISQMFRVVQTEVIRVGVRSMPMWFRDQLFDRVLVPAAAGRQVSGFPHNSETQMEMLYRAELDFATIWEPANARSGVRSILALTERLSAVVPATSFYRDLAEVRPEHLSGLRLAAVVDVLHAPGNNEGFLDHLPHVDRIDPAVQGALPMLLAGGRHCAFLPASYAGMEEFRMYCGDRVIFKPLADPAPTLKTYVVWRADQENDSVLEPIVAALRRAFPSPVVA